MTNRLKKNCTSVSDASYGFIVADSSSRDVAAEYLHFRRIARHLRRPRGTSESVVCHDTILHEAFMRVIPVYGDFGIEMNSYRLGRL